MEILSCKGLKKIYFSGSVPVTAVNDVRVSFDRGGMTAVTGPSGSGKSTLLHVLGALEYPSEGTVLYQGKDLFSYRDDQLSILRRRRFGFVFQAYHLLPELTALENVLVPAMLEGKDPEADYLDALVDTLGIRDRLDHLPGALSGGQQQRVCLARALCNRPDILFADEPTGNLDREAGRAVMELIHRVHQELGVTVILVTHDENVAAQAERILRLEDGKIVSDERRAP